jgi:PAS domain S-box-containing protein
MKRHPSSVERFPREIEILRQLADGLPQIVWVARPDGSHEYYNKQWEDYTGLTLEKSTDAAWRELFHPEDRNRAETLWSEALRNGTPYEIEFRLRRSSDGAHRWFLGRALPYHDATGAIVKWFGTCTDIHEQKLTQEALRAASEALRRESVQKDEFLGVVSHELRTPLNAVFGWARLLQEDVLGDDERTQAVSSIMRNAEAQARLIEDVLDITRIVNNKLSLDRKIVNVWHVATEALEAVLPSADAKGVSIVSEVDSHDMLVFGDSLRLRQAALNLLTNAVKFTPPGGEVRLELRRRDDSAAIVVTDSGQGIAPELLPHVFERFRQADSSSTRRHGGLGLGLSIAHQLVLLHGGTIEVESAGENKGSRFTVLLPILAVGTIPPAQTESHAWGENAFPAEHLRGLHIMVVDDEPSVRELLALTLSKCGASVTLAASVHDALGLLPNLCPDVVVSDIAMPGIDGYEFIQKLRELVRPRGRQLPAIALTACASEQDRDLALKAGFDRHLSKRVDPAELVRAIAHSYSERKVGAGSAVAVVSMESAYVARESE